MEKIRAFIRRHIGRSPSTRQLGIPTIEVIPPTPRPSQSLDYSPSQPLPSRPASLLIPTPIYTPAYYLPGPPPFPDMFPPDSTLSSSRSPVLSHRPDPIDAPDVYLLPGNYPTSRWLRFVYPALNMDERIPDRDYLRGAEGTPWTKEELAAVARKLQFRGDNNLDSLSQSGFPVGSGSETDEEYLPRPELVTRRSLSPSRLLSRGKDSIRKMESNEVLDPANRYEVATDGTYLPARLNGNEVVVTGYRKSYWFYLMGTRYDIENPSETDAVPERRLLRVMNSFRDIKLALGERVVGRDMAVWVQGECFIVR